MLNEEPIREVLDGLKRRAADLLKMRRATDDFTEKNRLAGKESTYEHAAELLEAAIERARGE